MKKIKMPKNAVGMMILLIIGGIIANIATEPAARKVGELKSKYLNGGV